MRRAARRDDNEPQIIAALEQIGAAVQPLNADGVPDLLVGFRGRLYLLEVKMPLGPNGGESRQKLNAEQAKWWSMWKGPPPVIVRSVSEAFAAIGAVIS